MPTPQRLPYVNADDGQWGDILVQWLKKEHYDDGTDNAINGGHKTITVRAGTATAGTAPLKFTSGTLMSSPEAGAIEFLTDRLYFTITTGAVRKTIAAYDDSSGATGDIYYRSSGGAFTRLGIGSTGDVLKVSSGLPAWGGITGVSGTFADNAFTLQDNGDATKQLQFELSGITTGNTRTVTIPNSNTTLPIASQVVTIAGPTAARTYTFPDAAATIARTDAANTFTGVQTMTSPALTTPAITGLATGSGVASAATASTLVSRDSNANTTINNLIDSFTNVSTGGTTTLTASSTKIQYCTASSTQTIKLPDTSTLVVGQEYVIVNKNVADVGSTLIQVQTSAANTIKTLANNSAGTFICISTAGNTTAAWDYIYTPRQSSLTADVIGTLPIANGGTGQTSATAAFDALAPTTTQGDIVYHNGTNNVRLAAGTAGYQLQTNGASANPAWAQPAWGSITTVTANRTTTGQALVDVTDLIIPVVAFTIYEFEIVMRVGTSAVTSGVQYGLNLSTPGNAICLALVTGTTTTNAVANYHISAFNTPTSTFLTTASIFGTIVIKGWLNTGTTGTGNFSVQHLKVTSGTSTVYTGSSFRLR